MRLKRNAEEKVKCAFLPWRMAAPRCTVTFTDKQHGSFCYELAGTVLMPSVLAEHQLTVDLSEPAPVHVPLSVANPQARPRFWLARNRVCLTPLVFTVNVYL